MGLGKTIQTIVFLQSLYQEVIMIVNCSKYYLFFSCNFHIQLFMATFRCNFNLIVACWIWCNWFWWCDFYLLGSFQGTIPRQCSSVHHYQLGERVWILGPWSVCGDLHWRQGLSLSHQVSCSCSLHKNDWKIPYFMWPESLKLLVGINPSPWLCQLFMCNNNLKISISC